MLKIEHVTKVFFPGTINEKVALEDINLTVNEGDVVCVIGSNGSGKSTLFNMIAGTFPVTSGTIKLKDKDITHQSEHRIRLKEQVRTCPYRTISFSHQKKA